MLSGPAEAWLPWWSSAVFETAECRFWLNAAGAICLGTR